VKDQLIGEFSVWPVSQEAAVQRCIDCVLTWFPRIKMKLRQLGKNGPTVSAIGYGLQSSGQRYPYSEYHQNRGSGPDDWRRRQPWFQKSNLERNLSLVARLRALAEKRGITTTQLALGWLLNQGDHVVPIPGSRRAAHMETNAKAVDVESQSGELTEVARIVSDGVAGGRLER
jgi:aryl-alcohol dehydrogenase-like predicted oxidoreductase